MRHRGLFLKGNRMKMYPDDWRVRLTTGVVGVACVAAVMMLGHVVGIDYRNSFWRLVLLLVVGMIVGNVLGRLAFRLLFQPSSGRPPDQPPHA